MHNTQKTKLAEQTRRVSRLFQSPFESSRLFGKLFYLGDTAMMLSFSEEEVCKILSKHVRSHGLRIDSDVRMTNQDIDDPLSPIIFMCYIDESCCGSDGGSDGGSE